MSRLISEQQAADLLMEADNILLLAHRYPDGDTIGSNYALCLALRSLGKQVRVIGPEIKNATALDIDPDGGLMVQYENGTVATVSSGEVSVRGLFGYL